MLEFLQKPIDVLFDRSVSFIKKFFILISLIGLFLILDDIFQFSYHYVLSNKIEMVSNIEKIKIATIQGYNMNPELLSELDNIQSSVLDKASILSNISLYIKQVETGEISFDYKEFFSLQCFWILCWVIMISQSIKKGKNGIGEGTGLTILIILMMYVWYFLFNFISSVTGFKGIIFNLSVNIIFIIILAWIGKKNK